MLPVFESILPVFLVIVLGNVLRRLPLLGDAGWLGVEQLGYWVLYPALLFSSILHADFTGLRLDAILGALLLSITLLAAFVLVTWPGWKRASNVTPGEFSSVFQTAIRWNAFIALAVAQKIFPPAGTAVVALAMAVIIVPLNVMSVTVVAHFGAREADWPKVFKATATNPLILAVLAGVAMRWLPGGLYEPVDRTIGLVAGAAIGMGLITIGAGLRVSDMFRLRLIIWFPVIVKLVLLPALLGATAWVLGVRGPEFVYLVLCGAVPTAMNGYTLARQLGGDPALYAAITTLQTMLAALTMPVALALAAQFASG